MKSMLSVRRKSFRIDPFFKRGRRGAGREPCKKRPERGCRAENPEKRIGLQGGNPTRNTDRKASSLKKVFNFFQKYSFLGLFRKPALLFTLKDSFTLTGFFLKEFFKKRSAVPEVQQAHFGFQRRKGIGHSGIGTAKDLIDSFFLLHQPLLGDGKPGRRKKAAQGGLFGHRLKDQPKVRAL